ncbi:N-alpha-acetyl-L-2,4-diaminobutyric acid deacetylase [Neolewinella maritima]|uniref:N-alpha-acetyl-L-2,4-diaminobutyric acid deacetylase n=1 Tax=Neolewinella maritima TaxID=1383882 RepID=A0ABN8F1U9_9BACT|nr:succinylglutamate desuccinylase/aspartoacylase family protein [Neolewinella maritima]CAH0999073.1 N-alpha-acetyl-L-2,4-diaminobutyric acid deacetylase [Neolewinella maritima]
MTTNTEAPTILSLSEVDQPAGTIRRYWLRIISDGLGEPVRIPILVAKGKQDGPTLGVTAAVHGDELNGIRVIQRLFSDLDVEELTGTIIGVLVVNIPAFLRQTRVYTDGFDLNHVMPGKEDGRASEVYAFRLMDRIIQHFDYLLDLHTASRGRVNSYYVRADMSHEITRQLAILQNPQLIVHNPPNDKTLRGSADALDIPAITLEVGNPGVYQKKLIRSGIEGIHNALSYLKMTQDEIIQPSSTESGPILCKRSYWIYTHTGGLLTVEVDLLAEVKKGDLIASQRDVFGTLKEQYLAPEDGVVIGKSTMPVNRSGGRVLHLGIV